MSHCQENKHEEEDYYGEDKGDEDDKKQPPEKQGTEGATGSHGGAEETRPELPEDGSNEPLFTQNENRDRRWHEIERVRPGGKDKGRFAQALGDMATRPDSYQIWKDYDFLERPADAKEKDPKRSNDIDTLKREIVKMKHENKDLAAELDKHQSLLR